MADAGKPSQRTSHPGGFQQVNDTIDADTNEERVIRKGDETERTDAGVIQGGGAAYSGHADSGRRTTEPNPDKMRRDEGPQNRLNDNGELVEQG